MKCRHHPLREETDILERQLLRHAAEMEGSRHRGEADLFAPSVNGVNAAFGRVIRGMDVVRKIGNVRTRNDRPVEPVVLQHVRIEVVE